MAPQQSEQQEYPCAPPPSSAATCARWRRRERSRTRLRTSAPKMSPSSASCACPAAACATQSLRAASTMTSKPATSAPTPWPASSTTGKRWDASRRASQPPSPTLHVGGFCANSGSRAVWMPRGRCNPPTPPRAAQTEQARTCLTRRAVIPRDLLPTPQTPRRAKRMWPRATPDQIYIPPSLKRQSKAVTAPPCGPIISRPHLPPLPGQDRPTPNRQTTRILSCSRCDESILARTVRSSIHSPPPHIILSFRHAPSSTPVPMRATTLTPMRTRS